MRTDKKVKITNGSRVEIRAVYILADKEFFKLNRRHHYIYHRADGTIYTPWCERIEYVE